MGGVVLFVLWYRPDLVLIYLGQSVHHVFSPGGGVLMGESRKYHRTRERGSILKTLIRAAYDLVDLGTLDVMMPRESAVVFSQET